MTITQLLSQKGFIEGTDFSFSNGELIALPKIRQVEQLVETSPAVLDSEGLEISPAVTELQLVDETYTEQIPELSSLKWELVRNADAAMLISEYLEGKERSDDDSLNIDLFLSGGNGWRFANIPAPSVDELLALIPISAAKQNQAQINAQAQAFLAATDYIVVRAAERGEQLSPEFKAERQAARDRIVK